MEEITLPKMMNTEDKYNRLIHETNTLQKFEALYMKMLSDDYLDMSEIFTLMKIIERDVILVHKLPEVSALMDMTETFIKYMIIKDDERSKKEEEEEQKTSEQENMKEKKKKKFVKDTSQKPKKQKNTTIPIEEPGECLCSCSNPEAATAGKGIWQCDC